MMGYKKGDVRGWVLREGDREEWRENDGGFQDGKILRVVE